MVGAGLFTYQIPADTFYDVNDMFNLVYSLTNTNLPAWLTYDPVTRTFSGVPTNADLGVVSIRVVAANTNMIVSLPEPFAINVVQDYRFSPPLTGDVVLDVDIVPQQDASRRRRMTAPSCPDTLPGTVRSAVVESLASALNASTADVNLISVDKVAGTDCNFAVRFADNRVEGCEDAQDRQAILEDANTEPSINSSFATVFSSLAPSVNVTVLGVSLNVSACEAKLLPEVGAAQDRETQLVAGVVPAAVIAAVLLLLGLIGFVAFRKRAHKEPQGINETFFPREPVVLDTERNLDFVEVQHDWRDPTVLGPDSATGSVAMLEYAPPKERRPPAYVAPPDLDSDATGPKKPPLYRPPPSYPFEGQMRGADFLGLGPGLDSDAAAALLGEFGPDGFTTTTVTTTTTTTYGRHGQQPPIYPDQLVQPAFASSYGNNPRRPRDPPEFAPPPSFDDTARSRDAYFPDEDSDGTAPLDMGAMRASHEQVFRDRDGTLHVYGEGVDGGERRAARPGADHIYEAYETPAAAALGADGLRRRGGSGAADGIGGGGAPGGQRAPPAYANPPVIDDSESVGSPGRAPRPQTRMPPSYQDPPASVPLGTSPDRADRADRDQQEARVAGSSAHPQRQYEEVYEEAAVGPPHVQAPPRRSPPRYEVPEVDL